MYSQGGGNVNIGNIRETFYMNQQNVKYKIIGSEDADMPAANKYTFEIGEKKQTR